MREVSKDIERLISRRLDGELSEDEELLLNRELIRDPLAHRLMEQSERIDRRASAALTVLFASGKGTDDARIPAARSVRRHVVPRSTRWLIPGAIAAALLALVVPRPDMSHGPDLTTSSGFAGSRQPITAPVSHTGGGDLFRNVKVPTTQRLLGRDLMGVVAEDGSVYWIEVDRTRTLRLTPATSGSQDTQRM